MFDEAVPAGGLANPALKPQYDRRAKELEDTSKSLPVLEEVIAAFDALIEENQKLTNLDPHAKIPVEAQLLAFQTLVRFAKKEKAKFETRFKDYLKATEEPEE